MAHYAFDPDIPSLFTAALVVCILLLFRVAPFLSRVTVRRRKHGGTLCLLCADVISRQRLRKHLRICTVARDAAAELLQPFACEHANDVRSAPVMHEGQLLLPQRVFVKNLPPYFQWLKECRAGRTEVSFTDHDDESGMIATEYGDVALKTRMWNKFRGIAGEVPGINLELLLKPDAMELLLAKRWNEQCAILSAVVPGISSSGNLLALDKHKSQCAALLALCLHHGYLQPKAKHLIVELGAGKGGLSNCFVLALQRFTSPDFFKVVLVEKEKRRNVKEAKNQNSLIDHSLRSSILRLRLAIEDFSMRHLLMQITKGEVKRGPEGLPRILQYLNKIGGVYPFDVSQTTVPSTADVRRQLELLAGSNRRQSDAASTLTPGWLGRDDLRVSVLAKHLCGSGTDAAIRCVANSWEQKAKVQLCIATCCHHRCEWDTFVGQKWLSAAGVAKKDFENFVRICGWATGATGIQREIGQLVKRILDLARVLYLREIGFEDASLEPFIIEGVTLENMAITGTRLQPLPLPVSVAR